jgi:hypothetical protein
VALDVLANVASEYLLNVGRTMRFLCDKYGSKMTPEVCTGCHPLSSLIGARTGNYPAYII